MPEILITNRYLRPGGVRSILLLLLLSLGLVSQLEAQVNHEVGLDELDISKIYQGKDRPRHVGLKADIKIDNRRYPHGVHTRTMSKLYLELDGNGRTFTALVGIDDRADSIGNAEFYVIGDGAVLWKSGILKPGNAPVSCRIQLRGVKNLLLKVTGSKGNVHVDWANAKLSYTGKRPQTTWSPEDLNIDRKVVQPPEPRINGAMAVGVRPGTPFRYPLAITGIRPLKISVEGLPQGLSFDENSGIISGIPIQKGDYHVFLKARNNKGLAQRFLRILVGDTLALTPPMGFLSWNVIQGLISQTVVKEMADAFVDYGLRDVGYQYIIMDDCWAGGRDGQGNIYADSVMFPDGIKKLADYLHNRGLFFGLYSSPGAQTCAGYPGSLGYETQDVQIWASWGIDYLKYDRCSAPKDRAESLYVLMGRLLKQSGRSIVYGLGTGDIGAKWGNEAHAQLWRTAGDIRDQWELDGNNGLIECFDRQKLFTRYQRPGGWNDPDMLMAGIFGKGASSNDLGAKGSSFIEYQSQMSLWSLLSAPLFISADIRNMAPATLRMLTNPEVIDVDQDIMGNLPVCYLSKEGQEVWVKNMSDGSKTIGLLNRKKVATTITVNWKDIGLKQKQKVRNLWMRKNEGIFLNDYSSLVDSHGVVLIRVYPY